MNVPPTSGNSNTTQAVANGKPRIVATYDYRDERGELLFQSVRREPGAEGAAKDFRQRRPDGKGGWTWNLKGVRLVTYRLPELLAADPSRPVFIVEGEKDVESLARIGLIATTNPMGAGKWRAAFNQFLANREVVILPDNDDAGRKHAAGVARQLKPLAKSVHVVELPELPPKGDVSDWLVAPGNDKIKLLELVQATQKEQARAGDVPYDAGPRHEAAGVHLTDTGNAKRLIKAHGADLRHCWPWRKWAVWDETRWAVDDTGAIVRCAKRTIADLFAWTVEKMAEMQKQLDAMGDSDA